MKVAFDEHVPITFAEAFIALAKEKKIRDAAHGLVLEKAKSYAPRIDDKDYIRKSDVPWLDRFAASGGRAIISGDVKMREKPHELLALYSHAFVVIFFERQWSRWDFYQKSSLLLHWWEPVTNKIRTADKATFWVVPSAWTNPRGDLKNVSLGLAQMLRDKPTQPLSRSSSQIKVPKVKSPRRALEPRQQGFLDELEVKPIEQAMPAMKS